MSKRVLGLVVVGLLVMSACGSSTSASAPSAPKESSTSSKAPAGAGTDATSTTLQLVDTALGKLIADSEGRVLYEYVPDRASTESTVPPGVLSAWPPLVADGVPTRGPGLTAKSATGTQPNGEEWVMYNGHLLYRFTGDANAGDVDGNGVGNIWYALTAAGEPVQS